MKSKRSITTRKWTDRLVRAFSALAVALAVLTMLWIIGTVIAYGHHALRPSFLINPSRPYGIANGGIANALLGTIAITFGAAAIAVPPPWFEQETIRGEFLRMIRDWREDPRAEIDLTEYLPECYLAGSLSSAAVVSDKQELARILAEAAMLGVDLLTPEGPES